jgi:hypothetical protein
MDIQVVYELRFGYFTYAQKDNKIIFSTQLNSCQNSFRINRNHRNNIITVATGNDNVNITRGYRG